MKSVKRKHGPIIATLLLGAFTYLTPVHVALAAPDSEGQSYLTKAIEREKSGDIAGAIILLKNAVRVDPELTAARFQLGLMYLRSGDPGSAQRELEAARTRGYDETAIIRPLLQAYLAQGRFQDIIKNFDPAKLSGNTLAELLAIQARAQLALQDTNAARALIDKALAQAPTLPVVLSAAATLARIEARYADAEKLIDQGLAAEPENAELLVLKAEARQQEKDYDGAMKPLNLAISKQPKYARARLARAMINLTRNQPETVPDDVREILAVDPKNPLGLYLRAVLLSREGKYRDSTQVLMALPELLDSYPPARYLLSASSFADNQFQSALSNAELYLKKVPGDRIGSTLLAAIAMRLNEPKRAVEVLEPLAQANPDDNQIKLQLAGAYLGVGRSEEAIKLFEQGVKADPNNADARMALAVSQLQSGAVDAGVGQLQSLIASKPDSLRANQLLALTQIQNKQLDKAMATADAMVKAAPKDPEAYNLKGTVSLASNDIEGARAAFKSALEKNDKFTQAMLNLARIEAQTKKFEASKDWFRKVIAVEPANQTAFSGLVDLALSENKVEDAVKLLDQAIAVAKADPGPRLRLIDVLMANKQTGRALVAARELSNVLPDDPRSLDAMGRAQIASGEFVTGISSYRKLVSLSPNNAEAKRRLARALIASSEASAKPAANPTKPDATAPAKAQTGADKLSDEAKTILDEALRDAPDYVAALTDRLALERKMSGDAAALKLAQKFVKDKPESMSRLLVAGDVAAATGNNEAAISSYRTAWDKTKNGETARRLAEALVRDKKSGEAVQLLKKWTTDNPTDYDSRFMVTSIAISEGKYDEALAETEAMKGAIPDNPVLLNNLAWLYGEKNNPRAFEFGQKALELAPQSADILDTVGWLEVQKRDLKKGVELLEKAYGLAPANPAIAYHYAAGLKRNGNAAKAKEVLQAALKSKVAFNERAAAENLLKEVGG